MASNLKEEINRHYFELFSKCYSIPAGEVTYGDKPDVIIDGKRRIGIELTNSYLEKGKNPESIQNQRQIRRIILKKLNKNILIKEGSLKYFFHLIIIIQFEIAKR